MSRCTTKVLTEQFDLLMAESDECQNEAGEIMKVLKRREKRVATAGKGKP
jgi:hypothetical protein